VSPDAVLLFALDLDYRADADTKTFVFTPDRQARLRFSVPSWVTGSWQCWKVEADGLRKIPFNWERNDGLAFSDRITEVGIYVLLPDDSASEGLQKRFKELKKKEAAWPFISSLQPDHLINFL
jgi:phage tail protein X